MKRRRYMRQAMKDKNTQSTTKKGEDTRKKERLNCALVGCGRVAAKHLKAIRSFPKDLILTGVVDPRPEAAIQLLQQTGIKENPVDSGLYHRSLKDLLASTRPDLVAITTPSGTHTELALSALDAGCHVLVEKPMTLSLHEADQLIGKAAAGQKTLAVGHIYRYFPLIRSIRQDLAAGRFGSILSGRVTVYWGHDQAYYDAAGWRGTWRQDGGALMNQCVHALDLMLYFMGSGITQINGWIDQIRHHMEAEDYGLVQMRFENGAYGILEGSTATNPNRQEASFSIQCTEGSIDLGFCRGKPSIRILDAEGHALQRQYITRFIRETLRQDGIRGLGQSMHPHTVLYRDLIRAVRTGDQPLADGSSGRHAVEAVLGAYASALSGRTCSLPIGTFSIAAMEGFFDQPDKETRSDG